MSQKRQKQSQKHCGNNVNCFLDIHLSYSNLTPVFGKIQPKQKNGSDSKESKPLSQ